jgi:hypothetical protein
VLISKFENRTGEAALDGTLEYAEMNKSRLFASSWGQSFSDGLRSQVPPQLLEQERELLARQTSVKSKVQEWSSGQFSETSREGVGLNPK